MTLQVIGAGWGRTGTMSLKAALDDLGYRSHHMHEVFLNPEHIELFTAAARGEPDWHAIYDGYRATVDWPGAAFWRELADEYPDAKVLLSVRDPEEWYESFRATIYEPLTSPDMGTWGEMVRVVIVDRDLGGRVHDKEYVIDAFARHNDEVRGAIEPARLLEYRVGEGWDRLCAFLDVDVPDTPFPHTNDRASFLRRNADVDDT